MRVGYEGEIVDLGVDGIWASGGDDGEAGVAFWEDDVALGDVAALAWSDGFDGADDDDSASSGHADFGDALWTAAGWDSWDGDDGVGVPESGVLMVFHGEPCLSGSGWARRAWKRKVGIPPPFPPPLGGCGPHFAARFTRH